MNRHLHPHRWKNLAGIGLLYACVALSGACSATSGGHEPLLVERLDAVLYRLAGTGATVTARVLQLPGGRELYAASIDEPFAPASNMKLPISAAGLDLFGADWVFKTYLAFDGRNLWLVGTGDPATGDPAIAEARGRTTTTMLAEWSQALRNRGITRVPGHLYYYDGALEPQQLHGTWEPDDLLHWYAAPISGLNFNDNCVDVTVFPTEEGEPARYEIVPPVSNVIVINRCLTGEQNGPEIVRDQGANVVRLSGRCGKETALTSKPIVDPGAFFADALRTRLERDGIVIGGQIRPVVPPLEVSIPPPADQIVATHESSLRDILWRINKSSQNLFAECLCKMTGRLYEERQGRNSPGSWAAGELAIRAFLRENGIDDGQFVLADGSGLSRGNRVTSRLVTDVLATMHAHPAGEVFRASLSAAGKDGTLRVRMKELAGHVFAKTGYISGVRALSGYVQTRRGRWLCFSIIYNNISGNVKPFEALQDEACALLVDWPDLPDEPATSPVAVETVASR